MSCGRLTDFRFNHLYITQGGKSNSLEAGSIVHTGLEQYYKKRTEGINHVSALSFGMASAELYVKGCQYCTNFEPKEIHHPQCPWATVDIERLRSVCGCPPGFPQISKPPCGHKVDEYPGVQNTPMDNTSNPSRIGWRWALETLEQYFEYYKHDIWTPLEVEKVLSKILYEDENIRVLWKAKLDLVMDTGMGIFPVDHKTMKQRRDIIDLNNQFIGQCLMLEKRGMWINKVGFQTTLKPEEKFTRTQVNYTADRLLEWQSEILPYWAYQLDSYNETGYWPPNFNNCENKYGGCVYQNVCQANRSMREETFRLYFMKGKEWNPTNEED